MALRDERKQFTDAHMTHAIIIFNAGSSSLKFSLYRADGQPGHSQLLCRGNFNGIGHEVHFSAHDQAGNTLIDQTAGSGLSHADVLDQCLKWIKQTFIDLRLLAAGHRVVHGGGQFSRPVIIDADVLDTLQTLIPLAPLHQPHNLAAIRACALLDPRLTQIACFDTAFHHTQPDAATALALPADIIARGVRRYGFHGLSYEYIASQLPAVLGADNADGRVIAAHLGNGASLCGLHQRHSLATTMGFSTLDGVPMSSRCGSLDPGVLLYLLQELGMNPGQLSELLYRRSGLLGLSGGSDDMRALLTSPDPAAWRAIEIFVYRISREIGSLAAALQGLDALVFTAGIGENAPQIRARVCRQAAWLGIKFDAAANDPARLRASGATHPAGAACISAPDSPVAVWVIPTDEDLMIARHTWGLLRGE
jgi:acetate kinase